MDQTDQAETDLLRLNRAQSASTVDFSQFHTFLSGAQHKVSRGHFIWAQTQSMAVLMTDSSVFELDSTCVLKQKNPKCFCFYSEQTIKFYSVFFVLCSKWRQETEHFICVDETEGEKVSLWWSASKKNIKTQINAKKYWAYRSNIKTLFCVSINPPSKTNKKNPKPGVNDQTRSVRRWFQTPSVGDTQVVLPGFFFSAYF